jgi:hypothetical protein
LKSDDLAARKSSTVLNLQAMLRSDGVRFVKTPKAQSASKIRK